jgi:hypothetical protein
MVFVKFSTKKRKLFMFFKFPVFECYPINRVTITTLITKVSYIPKGVRSEIPIFSAFLTIYEGHRRDIQIVLYQGR